MSGAPKINDGGPAFPTDNTSAPYCGMTLRDYFAAKAAITNEDLSTFVASAVMGEMPPQWSTENNYEQNLACVKWWAEAVAKLRFIHADAMLAARQIGGGE